MSLACVCGQCGKAFTVGPWEIANGWGHYCSRACHTAADQHKTTDEARMLRRIHTFSERVQRWQSKTVTEQLRVARAAKSLAQDLAWYPDLRTPRVARLLVKVLSGLGMS